MKLCQEKILKTSEFGKKWILLTCQNLKYNLFLVNISQEGWLIALLYMTGPMIGV